VPAARRGEVDVQDLPLPSNQHAEASFEEFDKNWNEATSKTGDKPSLMKVRAAPTTIRTCRRIPAPRRARSQKRAAPLLIRRFVSARAPPGSKGLTRARHLLCPPAGAHQDLRPRPAAGRHVQADVDPVRHHGR
jgi:hypothetical protein